MGRDLVLFSMGRITERVKGFLAEELRKHGMGGLGVSHMEIIGILTRRENVQLKELVELIGKDKSTITALTKKLMRMGLVRKITDSEDSRVSHIALTDKGRRLEPGIMRISRRLRKKAYRGLTKEELDRLSELLEKMRRNF
jgi:DNA-binding MarR family transcriptional regulator